MNHIKKLGILGILMIALISSTACNKNSTEKSKENATSQTEADTSVKYVKNGDLNYNSLILTVDDIEVGYDEVQIYMDELKNHYEEAFGTTIWNFDLGDGRTFEDMAKEETINQIVQLKIMGLKAADLGVSLTSDEKDEISLEVKAYLDELSEETKKEKGITKELVTKVYTDNYLGSKVFTVATNDVDTEVTDDEAKQITIWQLFIQTQGEDANGNEIKLSDEEKKAALKKTKKLLKEAKKSDDFYSFAEKYTDGVDVEYTFGKGDMESAIEDAAFALKKGDFSGVVEGEDGYYILYCVSDYDEEATADAKEEIIASRQDEAFKTIYSKWSEEYKVAVNASMWDKVTFVEHRGDEETVTEISNEEEQKDGSKEADSEDDNSSEDSDSLETTKDDTSASDGSN